MSKKNRVPVTIRIKNPIVFILNNGRGAERLSPGDIVKANYDEFAECYFYRGSIIYLKEAEIIEKTA